MSIIKRLRHQQMRTPCLFPIPPPTDSTIDPPKKPASLFNELFMAARREEGCYEKSILKNFDVRKRLSNDDVGAARGAVFQELRPGAGFKTGDFVKI